MVVRDTPIVAVGDVSRTHEVVLAELDVRPLGDRRPFAPRRGWGNAALPVLKFDYPRNFLSALISRDSLGRGKW